MKKIRVSVYEDNKQLRDSLALLIENIPDFELLEAYPNALNILENTAVKVPDVILMDIGMPGINGIEAVKMIRDKFPQVKVVMQTVFDDDDKVFHSICAGAVGYLLKKSQPAEIIEAIRQSAEGGAPMTSTIAARVLNLFRKQNEPVTSEKVNLGPREKEILHALTKGCSYKMIAAQCNISLDTVRFHIKNIYEKLHVHSMTEAVLKAMKDKLV
jgi:DNA-binding NarL/FixJ family response regulator